MDKNQLNKKILEIKNKILALGPLRPGSITEQYNVCGSPGCKCKNPTNPRKHGPYYKLRFTQGGVSSTKFIKHQFVRQTENQLKEYKKLKKLVDELIKLSTMVSDLEQSGL